jgi:hypothetical protein
MYSLRFQGLLIGRRWWSLVFAVSLLVTASGCDIEWGGASVHLEDPSPPPEEASPVDQAEEQVELPLPEGPLLWVLRSEGSGGDVLALPIARLADGAPAPLDFPEPPPDGYRERFDASFAAEGTELALGAAGHRIGSVVFSGPPRVIDAGCPSAVPASALVLPRATLPAVSFALGPGLDIARPDVPPVPLVDNRIRTFGPILAEQLLRQGGEVRPFLAQRADLHAVSWAGDASPAMAATYLINDELTGPGPTGAATSLFFLSRFGPS